MRHRVAHRKLGRVTRASHRAAPQPGHRAHPPRADRDDRAEGEGAAALRRAADHHRQARPGRRRRPHQGRSTRAGSSWSTSRTAPSSASCSTRSRRASQSRPGGYTRLLRLGYRRGDSAEVAQIELVGSEYNPNADVDKTDGAAEKPAKKSVGQRLKAAADRVRGKKGDGGEKTSTPRRRAAIGRSRRRARLGDRRQKHLWDELQFCPFST